MLTCSGCREARLAKLGIWVSTGRAGPITRHQQSGYVHAHHNTGSNTSLAQVLSGERWVVLNKTNQLLWFPHVVNPSNINLQKASQSCNMAECTIEEKADRKLAFIVVTKSEKITFTARTEVCRLISDGTFFVLFSVP